MSLGENIKNIRKNIKMKQSELAEKLNVTTRTIQNYESGNREPNIETLKKIAEILDIPMTALIGDDFASKNNLELIESEIDKVNNTDLGILNAMRKLNKKPSDIKREDQLMNGAESINNDFDTFASNQYIENDIGYKYSDFDFFEQDELCTFIREMLRLKILDIKSRKK